MKKHLHWKSALSLLAISLIALGLFIDTRSPEQKSKALPQAPLKLDLLAPKGHSLFPIKPLNHEALSGVMGAMGTVAVYDGETSRLVVDGLKLIRSQENPETFLALVPDQKMSQMIQVAPRIIAVLKNPKASTGTNFVNKNSRSQRSVFYGLDSL